MKSAQTMQMHPRQRYLKH